MLDGLQHSHVVFGGLCLDGTRLVEPLLLIVNGGTVDVSDALLGMHLRLGLDAGATHGD